MVVSLSNAIRTSPLRVAWTEPPTDSSPPCHSSRVQLNVTTWFHPTVTGFTSSGTTPRTLPLSRGTMLHVDIGITAMNMNTDTQHLGYILDEHETDAPKGLKEGLRRGNRMQDLVRDEMRLGRKGDEVLSGVRERMKGEEIEGLVYCHPIGKPACDG
jgi:hypothetical protein